MKAFLTFLLLLGLSGYSYAQNNWLRRAGGSANDEASDVVRDPYGDLITTGYFFQNATFGSSSLNASGASDIFVHKTNYNGETIWVKKYGGLKTDRATSVACDGQGNIYITGMFVQQAQFGSIELTSAGDSLEIFVAKLDPVGNVIWAKSCGGARNDISNAIAVDFQGNVYITGQFKSQAYFGNFVATSTNNSNGLPTFDVFAAKLNADGQWQWIKKGSAQDQDRGLAIGTDGQGNVYVSGQFSGDLTFTLGSTHTNTVANAGFLIKFDSLGNEIWFIQFSASQTLCYDLVCDYNGSVYLTGDYIGQLMILDLNAPNFLPSQFTYNVFVAKISPQGLVEWASKAGSDNQVSSNSIALNTDGSLYIAGTFRCVFTQYSLEFGSGLFNSSGFKDVFLCKYSPTGDNIWSRQFGGPGEDLLGGVAAVPQVDKPVICGAFNRYFNIPADYTFLDHSGLFVPPSEQKYIYGSSHACENGYDIHFQSVKANSGSDVFLSSPYSSETPLYDYYMRGSDFSCDLDALEPCLTLAPLAYNHPFPNQYYGNGYTLYCNDTIHICQSHPVLVNTRTHWINWLAPKFSYEWPSGCVELDSLITTSGLYNVLMRREDQCQSWNIEQIIEVHPFPLPTISDDVVINTNAIYPQSYEACQDTIILTGGGVCDNCTYNWSGIYSLFYSTDLSINIAQTDLYRFAVVDEFGCAGYTEMIVKIDYPIIIPDLNLAVNILSESVLKPDSISICRDKDIKVYVTDSLNSELSLYYYAQWQVFFEGQLISSFYNDLDFQFTPIETGLYEFVSYPEMHYVNLCDTSIITYETISRAIFITILEKPIVQAFIDGENDLCPGELATLYGGVGEQIAWSGPGILQILALDTIVANSPGNYTQVVSSTSDDGCVAIAYAYYLLNYRPTPNAYTIPANGIVCPGSTVQLVAQTSLHYQWIGPLGETLDTTQSIYVGVPGMYYCICTDFDGCIMQSNIVEAKEYNSPYLVAFPGTDLCVNGNIELHVESNDATLIQWQWPLVGGNQNVVITQPGIYQVQATFCGITENLSIQITQSETPSVIIAANTLLCDGSYLTLQGNPGMIAYQWSNGDWGAQIQINQPGTYILTTIDEIGCMGISAPVFISLHTTPAPTPLLSLVDVCMGEAATLLVSPNDMGTVYWSSNSVGNPILGQGPNFTTASIFEDQTYYAIFNDGVCNSTAVSIDVNIHASSITPTINSSSEFCEGGTITLAAISDANLAYHWYGPVGIMIGTGSSISIPNATALNEGWYYVNVSDQFCVSVPDSIYVSIVLSNQPTIELLTDSILCEGNLIHVQAQVEADTYTWYTPTGSAFQTSHLTIQNAETINTGWYLLDVEGGECIYLRDSIYISVIPYPVLSLTTESLMCEDGYLTAFTRPDIDHYLWSTGDTTSFTIPDEIGWLYITAYNDPGCYASDSIYVENIDCLDQFVNIITPNGDGKNDYADFRMLRMPIKEVRIYNRWGNLIKTLKDPMLQWYGNSESGADVMDGTYFYSIEPKDRSEKNMAKSWEGYLQVLRNQ